MTTNELAQKVKSLRNRKGYSQEELAEKTGLSLRTIQRIENGETDPRGDSLKRLAAALNVSPDEIVDWTMQEDRGLLTVLNLSALSFLIFPLLGIIVPLILWVSKKGKIHNLDKTAKSILNFQITIVLIWFLMVGLFVGIFLVSSGIGGNGDISMPAIGFGEVVLFPFLGCVYNITLIIINAIRSAKGKDVKYFPKIRFIPN